MLTRDQDIWRRSISVILETLYLGECEPLSYSHRVLVLDMSSIVDEENFFLFLISDNRINQYRRIISRERDRIVSYDFLSSHESILTKRERIIESATDELIFVR